MAVISIRQFDRALERSPAGNEGVLKSNFHRLEAAVDRLGVDVRMDRDDR